MKKLIQAVVVLFIVAACAQLGAPPAENVQQSIAYGYSSVASVRNTAAGMLSAKTINVNDAKMVQNLADQARTALDLAAEASKAGKPADAASALQLATQVLTQLQTYLKSKGG
jgi:hypothetical protein